MEVDHRASACALPIAVLTHVQRVNSVRCNDAVRRRRLALGCIMCRQFDGTHTPTTRLGEPTPTSAVLPACLTSLPATR